MQQWLDTKLWEFDQWVDKHPFCYWMFILYAFDALGVLAFGFEMKWAEYLLIDFSGLRLLAEKAWPSLVDPSNPTPTIGFWLFSTYLAVYALAFQKFDSRKDDVVLRANSVLNQIAAVPPRYKEGTENKDRQEYEKNSALIAAFSQLPEVQHMWCPPKPRLSRPWLIGRCLIYQRPTAYLYETIQKKDLHPETVENLTAAVSRRRTELAGVDLFMARLEKTDLKKANLGGADLICANLGRADLEGAELGEAYLAEALLYQCMDLMPTQLAFAGSLYYTLFDPAFAHDLFTKHPDIWERTVWPSVKEMLAIGKIRYPRLDWDPK
jgi:hypothetical protein